MPTTVVKLGSVERESELVQRVTRCALNGALQPAPRVPQRAPMPWWCAAAELRWPVHCLGRCRQ